jgi:uncharacterized protein (DUF1501 family)
MSHLPAFGRRTALLGLAAALTLPRARVAFAQAPGEARLAVVLLRGGLDGLFAVQPYAERGFGELRGPLALPEPGQEGGLLDLGGRFGLHPRMTNLHAMYAGNEALVLHAVAGNWRTRSHFDAQDLLESGADQRLVSGWLNRALSGLPARPGAQHNGLAVGTDLPLLMRGPTAVANFAPRGSAAPPPDLLARIAELNAADPVTGPAIAEGLRIRGYAVSTLGEGAAAARRPQPGGAFRALALAAGRLLAQPDGPRVAAFELSGWDTHAQQVNRLNGPLFALDEGFGALKEALGDHWRRTAVLVVTEFGRTVRVNGTLGTDHGTGGVAFLLGGAVAGGRVGGNWPGLSDLFQNRDLAPTTDLRSLAKGLLRDHLKLPAPAVARAFPGSDVAAPLPGLVRT